MVKSKYQRVDRVENLKFSAVQKAQITAYKMIIIEQRTRKKKEKERKEKEKPNKRIGVKYNEKESC